MKPTRTVLRPMSKSELIPLTAEFGKVRLECNQAMKLPSLYPLSDTTRIRELPAFVRTYGIDRLNTVPACSSGEPAQATDALIVRAASEKFRARSLHCTFTTRVTQACLEPGRCLLRRIARDITPIDCAGNSDTFLGWTDIPVTRSHIPAVILGTIGSQYLDDSYRNILAAAYAHPL